MKGKNLTDELKLPIITNKIDAKNFFNLYWRYKFTIPEIARLFNSDITRILKILRDYEIPIRPLTTVPHWETFISSKKMFSNGQSEDSNVFKVQGFNSFDLFTQLQEQGTPTNSYVQIKVQFGRTKEDLYDYVEGPFGYLIQSEATTPINFCLAGRILGECMKINVTATEVTTLNGANCFIVSVKVAFR